MTQLAKPYTLVVGDREVGIFSTNKSWRRALKLSQKRCARADLPVREWKLFYENLDGTKELIAQGGISENSSPA